MYEKTFREKRSRYLESFKAMANPCREDEECLMNLESKHFLSKDKPKLVKSAKVKGKKQSKELIENCLVNGTKLKLFRHRNYVIYLRSRKKSVP